MKKILIFCLLGFSLFGGQTWKGHLAFGSYLDKGNVDKFDLKLNAGISRTDSTWETSLFAKAEYGEANSVKSNQILESGLKADYKPFATISPFVLATAYNNEFKDIELRLSGYLGAKYTFYNSPKADLSFSAALRFDWENYIESENAQKYRISLRPKFKYKVTDNTEIKHITFFVLDTENFSAYLVDSETTLKTKLVKGLALKIVYEIDFDNSPPTIDIEKTDHALSVQFELSF